MARCVFLAAGFSGLLHPSLCLATEDFEAIPLSPPYVIERFGAPIFFPSRGRDGAEIVTPGRKHLEIDKSEQRLRAYDGNGRLVLEAPVSTGKPGMDEKGRQRTETLSGIHRVFEVRSFKRWSQDPQIKMLNWIGIIPGVEKGIHSLEPVGEFANYEKLLGQRASHGCIRLSRGNGRWLAGWIGEMWKAHPLIVYIYDQPIRKRSPSPEDRYLLLLIIQEGSYHYDPLRQEAPSIRRDGTPSARLMKPGSFLLYKKEAETWHLISPSEAGWR